MNSTGERRITRLSVNVNDETRTAVDELTARHDTTEAEVLRRAVGVYKYVNDQLATTGMELHLVHGDEPPRPVGLT